ncbi:related to integral peroxisomal membrane protein [Melanopsichium pennsylvanicum]|uniref:Related to integral peroxisomal membrane protein n=2 Tax=Melanopsichium pennsylvanicum TaxID=63383 RepID=A0AAJ4XJ46_9BASI|nr:related to integral peroxisomal membrane protein [Melanopsichium pennsylvanicum 4]SNX83332.1 related to integral peroxisomal membrane protein [Melanopsichium pennsylvanicum]
MSTTTTPVNKDKHAKSTTSPSSIVTNASRIPSSTYSFATSLSSSFEPLSSSQILERVPSPVIRLTAALAPVIHAFHRFIRLATWTGGKGSNSSSMLLLVSFWLTCAFGYELVRYAPQLILLAWIGYAGIRRQLTFAKPRLHSPAKLIEKHDLVSAATINATLLELSELADFFSSLRKNVVVPAVQLISWDPSPTSTKAVAAFLILTWPLWLLAFLPLRESGFPSLVLPVSGAGILASLTGCTQFLWHTLFRLIGPQHVETLHSKAAPLYTQYHHLSAFLVKTPIPIIYAHITAIAGKVKWEQWTDFNLTLLPPYPIGALTVRSLVCFVGTLGLTWCSPWCSLFRQAVWKSATIRRVVRGTGRMLSGQLSPREAYGKGNLDDEWAHGLYHEDGSEIISSTTSTSNDVTTKSKDSKSNKLKTQEKEGKVVRHEDVVYQFSIFENQRWWVGLDWTAALLPQERPSWCDESNNPVSPPSSFSLPATKIMLTPAPTSSDPKAFTRRTIKWQWVDPEWSIAGVSSHGYYPSSTVYKGSSKDAAIKSAVAVGDKDALAAAKQGYLGDALNRIRARTSGGGGGGATMDEAGENDTLSDVGTTAHRVVVGEDEEEEWDVDPEGWQYGDNAWDKMSKKSGMGRYTRRRKWVRRAMLLEVVEYGIHGPSPASPLSSSNSIKSFSKSKEDEGGESESEDTKVDGVDSSVLPKLDTDVAAASTTEIVTKLGGERGSGPSSPDSAAATAQDKRLSVSDRLAKAAS